LTADTGHSAIEEDEREILRLHLAELVEAPGSRLDVAKRVIAGRLSKLSRTQEPKALFRQREEDLVLRFEVAVDRARAVFDLCRDIANRYLRVAVADEQRQR